MRYQARWPALVLSALVTSGCSINKMAVNKIGDALAGSGTTFSSDDDPDLVGQAVPFSLKLMESLLETSPRHRGLLFAASSGFTQYAYGYVQQEADEAEDADLARAAALRARARRLYLRARGYGLRGLEVRHAGFADSLRRDPAAAVRRTTREDVALLYWTAAAWGASIALSKEDPEAIAGQPAVQALIDRALELDESFEFGAIRSFLVTYEPSRIGGTGDPYARSRVHFERAVALSEGRMAGPYVSYAEAVSVARQDAREFTDMLNRALAIDADAKPEWRLANLIMQRRARWLLARREMLFLDPPGGAQ